MTRSALLALGVLIAGIAVPHAALAGGSGDQVGGYVDIAAFGEYGVLQFNDPVTSDSADILQGRLNGDAELGVPLGSSFAVQLGAWADAYTSVQHCATSPTDCAGAADEHDSFQDVGVASHFAFKLDKGSIGAMVSVGLELGDGDANYSATAALEATGQIGAVRLYGQLGYTAPVTGDEVGEVSTIYAQGLATYFVDPNLAVSGSLGVSRSNFGNVTTETAVLWGTQVETQLGGSAVSVYAGYQGSYGSASGGSATLAEVANGLYIGARAAFGGASTSLEDRATTAGLLDMNPEYGVLPH